MKDTVLLALSRTGRFLLAGVIFASIVLLFALAVVAVFATILVVYGGIR